jgi:hypothetical protein
MSLKKDFDELKASWSQASPLFKVYLAFSFFLSTSAIASLSEAIVKWRGFFLDALTFYHQVFSEPLRKWFLELGLKATTETTNYLVIFALILSAYVRMLVIERKNQLEVDWLLRINILLGIFNVSTLLKDGRSPSNYFWVLAALILIYPSLGLEPVQKRAFYIPIFVTLCAVCLFGAINAGLTH